MSNELINETSPYLLQHADNPVEWYPWGEDAFEKARCENKPIFLSVGYSTCHWCHVMAHESFENPYIAEYLNKNYVSVKVDREERPDIDQVYMRACQALTGSGGWPMSIFMLPDKIYHMYSLICWMKFAHLKATSMLHRMLTVTVLKASIMCSHPMKYIRF